MFNIGDEALHILSWRKGRVVSFDHLNNMIELKFPDDPKPVFVYRKHVIKPYLES